jgi:abhydrolase domain-containing protein 17
LEKKGFESTDILVFGISLGIIINKKKGSGPSVNIVSKYSQNNKKFWGVILQSPFTSIVKTKFSMFSIGFIDMFLNIDKIENVECPVFLIHGKRDEVVPFEHSQVPLFLNF